MYRSPLQASSYYEVHWMLQHRVPHHGFVTVADSYAFWTFYNKAHVERSALLWMFVRDSLNPVLERHPADQRLHAWYDTQSAWTLDRSFTIQPYAHQGMGGMETAPRKLHLIIGSDPNAQAPWMQGKRTPLFLERVVEHAIALDVTRAFTTPETVRATNAHTRLRHAHEQAQNGPITPDSTRLLVRYGRTVDMV